MDEKGTAEADLVEAIERYLNGQGFDPLDHLDESEDLTDAEVDAQVKAAYEAAVRVRGKDAADALFARYADKVRETGDRMMKGWDA